MKTTPPDNIVKLREESLKRFRERLAIATSISDAEFADVIYQATTTWGISETEFRDAFGLTGGAVGRWTTMKNLPQTNIRPAIFKWISDNLNKKD